MKKSLLALAALSAFAGGASAQSSVTLFGVVDAAFTQISAGGNRVRGLTNSNYNSSRLGFRGVEDLGGGLRAGFWLEGQLFNDSGDGNAGADFDFQRRSTVSLIGGFGEIRLGRDYTPNFWNTTIYDPFGTNGVGSSNTFGMITRPGGATTANGSHAVRVSNSIAYHLPALGGLFGQVTVGFGEQPRNPTAGNENGDYIGGRIGYAAGPLSMAVAYGKTDGATNGQDVKYMNFGGQFAFGAFTPQLIIAQEKAGSGQKVRGIQGGLLVTLGAGTIRASYADYDMKAAGAAGNNDWKKLALGYVHNLSKRTAVYTSYARVANDGAQVVGVAANGLTAPVPSAGGNSTGWEFGIRHSF